MFQKTFKSHQWLFTWKWMNAATKHTNNTNGKIDGCIYIASEQESTNNFGVPLTTDSHTKPGNSITEINMMNKEQINIRENKAAA